MPVPPTYTLPPAAPAVALRWRPDRAVVFSPDGAEVWHFGGPGPVRLGGQGAGVLGAAVDGARDLDAIVAEAVRCGMNPEDATRIAQRWRARGHLVAVAAPDTAPAPAVRLLDRRSGADALATQLAQVLRCCGLPVDADPGTASANPPANPPTNLSANAPTQGAALCVVLVDDLLHSVAALEGVAGPAVTLQLYGERALLSPLIAPGAACVHCLQARLRLRRSVDLGAAARLGLALPPRTPVLHPAGLALAAAAVAALVQSLAAGAPAASDLLNHVAVLHPRSARTEYHRLVPVAGCPHCDPQGQVVHAAHLAQPALLADRAPVPAPAPSPAPAAAPLALAERSGGLREVEAALTWQRYAHHISDIVGLVPQISALGPSDYCAFAAGPNVAETTSLDTLQSRLRAQAGGKGITPAAARTGALAEALERESLRARGPEPYRRARLGELEGAIHPNDILLYSERQLHQVEQLRTLGLAPDASLRPAERVPRPFDTGAEHDWCAVTDLRTGARRWLPAPLLWFQWPGCSPDYLVGSSNGAAAGNTLQEALLQGLLELVERDSAALWWYPRCRRPAFDLQAWDDPRITAALAPQRARGHTVWVLDLTSDLGIPAAVAVATGLAAYPQVPLLGFGAHLDPAIAVVRALTELAQMQAAISRHCAPLSFSSPAEARWFGALQLQHEAWLMPHGSVLPPACDPALGVHEALQTVVARLGAAGLDVLWADCTRPDIGLPVVRTWAPGLRHFWRQLAPGRLYQVPPALGWCAGGYTESELNPWSMIV